MSPLISKTAPARSPEEHRLVLATLPEPMLVQMISLQAGLQSEEWLRSMLEGGLLDVLADLKAVDSRVHMNALCSRWSCRVNAMTAFMKHVELEEKPVALNSDGLEGTQIRAVFPVREDFRQLFSQIAERVAESYSDLISRVEYGDWAKLSSLKDARKRQCSMAGVAVGRVMAAACLLDLPKSVRTLGIACPMAHTVTIPLSDLGETMNELRIDKRPQNTADPVEVTPYFVAMQLSHLQCMDYLTSCTMKGVSPQMGSSQSNDTLHPLTLATIHSSIKPAYEPQALMQALQVEMQNPTRRDMMISTAIHAMHRSTAYIHPYLATMLEVGLFDVEPAWAFQKAIGEGHIDIVRHLASRVSLDDMGKAGTDFTQTWGSPIYAAAQNSNGPADPVPYENTIMTFLEECEANGHIESAVVTFVVKDKNGVALIEPVTSLMQKGFGRVLACYLDHGLDPHARAEKGFPTLLEQADAAAPAMAQLIRSHAARREARALLNGIDEAPASLSLKS